MDKNAGEPDKSRKITPGELWRFTNLSLGIPDLSIRGNLSGLVYNCGRGNDREIVHKPWELAQGGLLGEDSGKT